MVITIEVPAFSSSVTSWEAIEAGSSMVISNIERAKEYFEYTDDDVEFLQQVGP